MNKEIKIDDCLIEELLKDLESEINVARVQYNNIGGFGWKDQVQHDKEDLFKKIKSIIWAIEDILNK